ncbi:hypothetical protein VTI74DRAFT_4071 [Chaetomium olivicolor]
MPSPPTVTPLPSLDVSTHTVPAHPASRLPNSGPSHKPLLIYRRAFPNLPCTDPSAAADTIEQHLNSVGAVKPQWRYGMYRTTHFHSTTHEVLCVSSGRAKLLFGGEENPGRVEVVVERGDVVVVPAGVAHRLLEEIGEGRVEMVGAYPVGAEGWDMCYGREGEEAKVEGIKGLAWFGRDPVYGEEGPVLGV